MGRTVVTRLFQQLDEQLYSRCCWRWAHGIGTTVSRFFIKMISLPMHCERGTGNNTYQLMWKWSMLSGFLFENMWTESHPDTIYWICIGICVLFADV